MDSKLWIIGDSFTGGSPDRHSAWVEITTKKFKGKKHHVSSKGSRDVQTIIDIFLRNLKNIKPEDLVILFLPTIARYRLPRIEPIIDVESNDSLETLEQKKQHLEFFSHLKFSHDGKSTLEYPLGLINETKWDIHPPSQIKSGKINFTYADVLSLIAGSDAMKNNLNEILFSFKNYFPFELALFSWTDEYDENNVIGKKQLTKEIGFWHTLNDEWVHSNGELGQKYDMHFSTKMHKAFGDYVINKFPQFFNT
jgi:hypothetical protein